MSKITQPVYFRIQQEATGKHMHQLFQQNGYTVKDVQIACGLGSSQAVYKWLSGQSLPSIECLLVLSRILHASIEEILVVDEDFFVPIIIRKIITKCKSTVGLTSLQLFLNPTICYDKMK